MNRHVNALAGRPSLRLFNEQNGIAIGDGERACPGANGRTRQLDLRSLMEKGLLRAAGATNRLLYGIKNKNLENS